MSSANPNRARVTHRGSVVPNLERRTTAGGEVIFEFYGRLNGKRRRIRLDASNATEAVEAVQSLVTGVREKRVRVASERRTTVAEAIPRYLAYLVSLDGTRKEKSPRSIEDIETKLRIYVEPALGHRPVSAVSEHEVRDLVKSRSTRGKSRSTVKNILSTASGFFAWAVRERIAGTNPVNRARELFGEELLPDTEPKEIRALSDEEIARAMEHLSETFLPIVQLCSETGMRISELLGVTHGRVDIEAESIDVAGQLGKDGKVRKTKTGTKREIPISPGAVAVLEAHTERKLEDGLRVDDDALVFVTNTGRPQSRRNVLRAWQNALEKIGVDDAGLHSLRHTFVSELAERDVPVAHAAALVGHARIATTQDTYTHVRGNREARLESLRESLRK